MQFLMVLCAVITAVDRHADLLRMSAAVAGNDHRLGGFEAPPTIISVFLGEQLTAVLERIAEGGDPRAEDCGELFTDVATLPTLKQDNSDRNRTSPFAFTGNKFEFRTVGSSASIAQANYVLNTIVAESLDNICTRLETTGDFDAEIRSIIGDTMRVHGRVVFNGNNYTPEWVELAKKRGLPNLTNTVDAAAALISSVSVEVLEKFHVLSRIECQSRYEIKLENYTKIISIEANTMLEMVRRQILPAVINYAGGCAESHNHLIRSGIENKSLKTLVLRLSKSISDISETSTALDVMMKHIRDIANQKELAAYCRDRVVMQMNLLREAVDSAEQYMPSADWPIPSYTDLLHRV